MWKKKKIQPNEVIISPKRAYNSGWRETLLYKFAELFYVAALATPMIFVIQMQFYVSTAAYFIAYDIILVLYVGIPYVLGVRGDFYMSMMRKMGPLYNFVFMTVLIVLGFFIMNLDQYDEIVRCISQQSVPTQKCIDALNRI